MTPEEKFHEHERFWGETRVNVEAAQAFLVSRGKIDDAVLLRALGRLREDVHSDSWDIA